MNVRLPCELEEFVRRKIAAGEFDSADGVVCEGLRVLQAQEEWKTGARRKIHLGWQKAKPGRLRTLEQVRENLSSRKQAWKRS